MAVDREPKVPHSRPPSVGLSVRMLRGIGKVQSMKKLSSIAA